MFSTTSLTAIAFALTGAAHLGAVTVNESTGRFENPGPPEALPFVEINNDLTPGPTFGDASIKWGEGVTKSEFNFDSFEDAADGTQFSVGEFSYYNFSSVEGTGISSLDFTVEIGFGSGIESFSFNLQVLNRPNSFSPTPTQAEHLASADWVKILNPTFTRTIEGQQFSINFAFDPVLDEDPNYGPVGFVQGQEFNVLEGYGASAQLVVTLSPVNSVPDLGSTLVLFGPIFASLMMMRRKAR